MLLNLAPNNEAILSNVGQIGEFRIRNSAKAFSILSSGLYANKIRAIVRELSCNAVDSHVAAGRSNTPFDVHLPNTLEPWFAIRDYGTGLSHEQVTNIYTTYFESTKTNSNDFIGALGLGSKSPFSYTDNFTVTAIKDGRKGIYTAFINETGVPSIAKMGEEATDEPAGVEVKFSVNDRWDFDKFRSEARTVYQYFKLQPVISGNADFTIPVIEYDRKDIIPGVHSYKDTRQSKAIMGNIAYPIDIPQAERNDKDIFAMLNCGLELHFTIGELDFQASREGLSYIPQTVNAIKAKLEAVNLALSEVLSGEASAITNDWEKTFFLLKKKENNLWTEAVKKYIADTNFDLIDAGTSSYYIRAKNWTMPVKELAELYNIDIMAFDKQSGRKAVSNLKAENVHVANAPVYQAWTIILREGVTFIKNDTKVGASARAKFHWNTATFDKTTPHYQTVYVLNKANKDKPAKFDEFLKAVRNPPSVMFASELMEKERVSSGLGKNVTILALQERGSGGYYREKEMVWRDAGKADSFDDATTYYYLPLSGFEVQSKFGMSNVKEFYNDLKECGLKGLQTTIYGVRKGDIEFIRTQKNWINIEDHISSILNKPIDNSLVMSLVLQAVDNFNLMQYNNSIVNEVSNPNSPYTKLVSQFKDYEKVKYSENSLKRLCNRYAQGVTFNPEAQVQKFVDECATVSKRYPLLAYLRSAPNTEVANYVNLIDTQKGV
jgi:hypothetical protein